jgi:hypothetical protein
MCDVPLALLIAYKVKWDRVKLTRKLALECIDLINEGPDLYLVLASDNRGLLLEDADLLLKLAHIRALQLIL